MAVEKRFDLLPFHRMLVFAGKNGKFFAEVYAPETIEPLRISSRDKWFAMTEFHARIWLSTHSQNTLHARGVFQLEPEFWIIPEPPAPVSLDIDNGSPGNEINRKVHVTCVHPPPDFLPGEGEEADVHRLSKGR